MAKLFDTLLEDPSNIITALKYSHKLNWQTRRYFVVVILEAAAFCTFSVKFVGEGSVYNCQLSIFSPAQLNSFLLGDFGGCRDLTIGFISFFYGHCHSNIMYWTGCLLLTCTKSIIFIRCHFLACDKLARRSEMKEGRGQIDARQFFLEMLKFFASFKKSLKCQPFKAGVGEKWGWTLTTESI